MVLVFHGEIILFVVEVVYSKVGSLTNGKCYSVVRSDRVIVSVD